MGYIKQYQPQQKLLNIVADATPQQVELYNILNWMLENAKVFGWYGSTTLAEKIHYANGIYFLFEVCHPGNNAGFEVVTANCGGLGLTDMVPKIELAAGHDEMMLYLFKKNQQNIAA